MFIVCLTWVLYLKLKWVNQSQLNWSLSKKAIRIFINISNKSSPNFLSTEILSRNSKAIRPNKEYQEGFKNASSKSDKPTPTFVTTKPNIAPCSLYSCFHQETQLCFRRRTSRTSINWIYAWPWRRIKSLRTVWSWLWRRIKLQSF